MRNPGAIAAGLIGAFDDDASLVEPQCHGTAPPRIDAIDDRHHRAAAKAGRHLADDSIDPAASDRECRGAGKDRDPAAARRVKAQLAGAIEPALGLVPGLRPSPERLAGLSRKKRARHLLALVG